MYRKEKSIQLKSSSAALYNNLSVLRPPGRQLACFSAVHGPSLSVVSADGLGFSHRQLQAKEGGMAVSTSILTQVEAPLLGLWNPPRWVVQLGESERAAGLISCCLLAAGLPAEPSPGGLRHAAAV